MGIDSTLVLQRAGTRRLRFAMPAPTAHGFSGFGFRASGERHASKQADKRRRGTWRTDSDELFHSCQYTWCTLDDGWGLDLHPYVRTAPLPAVAALMWQKLSPSVKRLWLGAGGLFVAGNVFKYWTWVVAHDAVIKVEQEAHEDASRQLRQASDSARSTRCRR